MHWEEGKSHPNSWTSFSPQGFQVKDPGGSRLLNTSVFNPSPSHQNQKPNVGKPVFLGPTRRDHAGFQSQSQAEGLKRSLEKRLGNGGVAEICWCNQWPSYASRSWKRGRHKRRLCGAQSTACAKAKKVCRARWRQTEELLGPI